MDSLGVHGPHVKHPRWNAEGRFHISLLLSVFFYSLSFPSVWFFSLFPYRIYVSIRFPLYLLYIAFPLPIFKMFEFSWSIFRSIYLSREREREDEEIAPIQNGLVPWPIPTLPLGVWKRSDRNSENLDVYRFSSLHNILNISITVRLLCGYISESLTENISSVGRNNSSYKL